MRSQLKVMVVGVVALFVCTAPSGGLLAQESTLPLPDADEIVRLMDEYDVPGLAMARLTDCELDEEVLVEGSATLAPEAAVTPRTAFEAASLSNPVFAWLVMSLAEEGTIDIDRPIAEKYDYDRIPDKAAYAKVTPRMVLMHRTGLPNWVDEDVDFYERTAPIPFENPPGSGYSYSGEAFQLLQAFVERETGKTLQQLFRGRLGDVMPQSTFVRPLPDGVTPSQGYRRASDPESGRGMSNLGDRGAAAYSLVTTARDYARFLSHLCTGGDLEPDTYAEMLRPQSPVPEDEASVPASYGLGWMIASIDEGTLVGHGGNNDEYRALAAFVRESGDGLVIFTNGSNGQALIDAITAPPSSNGEG